MPQLFYYKMRQNFITKCVKFLLQNATVLLQNTIAITNCDDFFTKCDNFITNCDTVHPTGDKVTEIKHASWETIHFGNFKRILTLTTLKKNIGLIFF